MKWDKVKLSEVCEVYGGTTPSTSNPEYWEGDLVWLSPSDLPPIGEISYVESSAKKITRKAVQDSSLTILPKGSVIYSTRASIGKIAIASVPLTTNQGFANFICNGSVFNKYLAYALKFYTRDIARLGTSTTFAEVSRTNIKNFRIPLPSLPIQEKIATILDHADALRLKNQLLLNKYNELLASVFYQMFGDPVRNEKGFDKMSLVNCCSKVTDGTHDTPERLKEGIKFITGKHIRSFKVDYDNSDYVKKEVHNEIYRRCNPEYGDVLYTNIGVNLATAAMNTVEYEFSMKNVALLKPKSKILTGRYLEHCLNNNHYKNKVVSLTGMGGAQQFLNLKQIKNLQIPVPPLSNQETFSRIIDEIEKQKSVVNVQLSNSSLLFQSLFQKAFKGELVK